jgi:beta-phosphoglucomutase-like phosphatase (HAD superfamily)
VQAGVAAGATVWGYSPAEAGHDAPAPLRAAGAAHIFADMAQLPRLLGGYSKPEDGDVDPTGKPANERHGHG